MDNLNRYTIEIVTRYNMIIGMIVTVLTAVFGEFWYLFAVFLVFNVCDWLSGWYKARKFKNECSQAGLRGLIKKLWYWVLILVAFLISLVFGELGREFLGINLDFLSFVGWFTLASLLVNEARSILENLVEIGVNVPVFLIKGLAVTEKLIKSRVDSVDGGNGDDSSEN